MDAMIERVARAIYDAHYSGQPSLAFEDQAGLWRRQARAAITAMRDPTDVMAEAVWAKTGDPCWKENAVEAWQAGIDAALIDTP